MQLFRKNHSLLDYKARLNSLFFTDLQRLQRTFLRFKRFKFFVKNC